MIKTNYTNVIIDPIIPLEKQTDENRSILTEVIYLNEFGKDEIIKKFYRSSSKKRIYYPVPQDKGHEIRVFFEHSLIRHEDSKTNQGLYQPIQKLPGYTRRGPNGVFGYIKQSPHCFKLDGNKLTSTAGLYSEKILKSVLYSFDEIIESAKHEWVCESRMTGITLPLPTLLDEKSKVYLTRPFIQGMTLEKYESSLKLTNLSNLFKVVENMMEAVCKCHSKGITHHDLSLDNFIIDPSSLNVTLIDFGNSTLPEELEFLFKIEHQETDFAEDVRYLASCIGEIIFKKKLDVEYFFEQKHDLNQYQLKRKVSDSEKDSISKLGSLLLEMHIATNDKDKTLLIKRNLTTFKLLSLNVPHHTP